MNKYILLTDFKQVIDMLNNKSVILTNKFLCVQFDVREFNIQIYMNKCILLTGFERVIDMLNNIQ